MDKTLIGDYLGTTEEYIQGEGTYAEDGKIYSSIMGEKSLDKENHRILVKGKHMPEIKPGQVVFGEVQGMRKNIVTIIVSKIEGFKQPIEVKTSLYVSNVANKYVENVESLFGIGDIVKARVLKVENELIDLETKDSLGVVKAFCKSCRSPLSKKGELEMECPSCGRKDTRKTASDYANVLKL
jgi:exosome complex component CSL4